MSQPSALREIESDNRTLHGSESRSLWYVAARNKLKQGTAAVSPSSSLQACARTVIFHLRRIVRTLRLQLENLMTTQT